MTKRPHMIRFIVPKKDTQGALSARDVLVATQIVRSGPEHLMDIGTVANVELTDSETARLLLKAHGRYEDNLIAATALHVNAHCIATRDAKFMKHYPPCLHGPTPG